MSIEPGRNSGSTGNGTSAGHPGTALAGKDVMKRTNTRKVAEILKRYGFSTARTIGKSAYRGISLDQFRRIERNYGIGLDTDGLEQPDVRLWRKY